MGVALSLVLSGCFGRGSACTIEGIVLADDIQTEKKAADACPGDAITKLECQCLKWQDIIAKVDGFQKRCRDALDPKIAKVVDDVTKELDGFNCELPNSTTAVPDSYVV